MSEVIVRNAIEYTKEKAMIMKLGMENEALNRGLEAMRADNRILARENKALRRELEESRALAKAARQHSRQVYEARIIEQAEAKDNAPGKRWERRALILIGMLIGMLILAGVTLAIFRPSI